MPPDSKLAKPAASAASQRQGPAAGEGSPVETTELETALRVLARVAEDRGALAGASAEERERLQRLAGAVARPDARQRRHLRKALARRDREHEKRHDGALREATGIRQLRQAAVYPTPLPPGGAPRAIGPGAEASPAGARAATLPGISGEGPRLRSPRKCYVCKASYDRLHAFYDQLCPACGDESAARRSATADLRGRVALVTGARVKIGYQAAVMLLRAGCRVAALTRFPRDAARRYAREPDFAEWQGRLTIHGIDLRHTPAVEALCRDLDGALPRLDFQIHNACQTVRRPPGFYAHLVEEELAPFATLPAPARCLLELDEAHRAARAPHRGALGGLAPALLTQAPTPADLLLGPGADPLAIFPRGQLDQDLQQIDLRTRNSWRLALHEVPTLELLEVLLVNATAPFVMTSRLKPLMLRARAAPPGTGTSRDPAKHVVMVSAMEGQFYREHKTDRHPHTNMAKAALNMLVRTSAQDLVRDGIHLNAVDTGWVTDEDPAHLAARKVEEHAFSPPLDVVDGAARVLAPIFEGFTTGAHAAGLFFKDYRAAPW